ncbi:HD domain protein containing protein [Fictibacillus macauensis ZFHKF-1]|uniref:HD domain protein containing protein n=1 Tax=Fictibacillus macauensis ZFHKF-1 TaxID=1196324 RepID=I8ADR7_9BACL|nr:HD domain-containing protein [Fictibacillus macauensis]EIT83712.1 HD domain protein containing protein [Fictibacillus macauensis ZFHKF-1]
MKRTLGQLHEEKVFKDPVHRYIHVRDELIWKLIGTREFQRLRRIRQLGTTYLTFHGAEHSRFSHSLGVYEITRRIVEVFKGRKHWNEEERMLALSAALLHDIGHGPFSHSFEKVFGLDHEYYTRAILLGNTEVNAILRLQSEDFPKKVAEVIEKTYHDKLVVSLISSQIDADRMDYLLRDAYFTGVSYGNFDLERILRVMRPMEDGAVIKASGMHAVEDYIMSRYQMYWQVYFHPVTRSAEVILSKILHRAKHLYEADYTFQQPLTHFHSLFKGEVTVEDYIRLDEGVMQYYFQVWLQEEDQILRDLCRRFLDRKLFKYCDLLPMSEVHTLARYFKEAGIDPRYYLVIDSSSDLPYDFYRPGEKEEKLPINLWKANGDISELSTESDVVEAISGKRRTDHKLYYPADVVDGLANQELKQKIKQLLHKG